MTPESFILAVLASLPGHTIKGKKRLQKLGMLMQCAGLDLDTEFTLHHYGPFSSELADAADELMLLGTIDGRHEQVGPFGLFQTVYRLPESSRQQPQLPQREKHILLELDRFTTAELEMASTIAYFLKEGSSPTEALQKASALKSRMAIQPVVEKAHKILKIVSTSKNGPSHDGRSTHT